MANNHHLNKYDYLQYLDCPETLWLAKNKPSPIEEPLSEEALHVIQQGNLIDKLAGELYKNPDFLREKNIQFSNVFFQVEAGGDGLATRCDILVKKDEDSYELYEVKASTSLKPEHLHDIAFQVVVFEQAGYPIKATFLVHVNNEYERKEEIDLKELLTITPTSNEVFAILPTTKNEIEAALIYINGNEPERKAYHTCSQKQDCPFFQLKFPGFPFESIFDIARIREPKIQQLLEAGIFEIKDIPEQFKLSPTQKRQVVVAKRMEPHIEKKEIREFLSQLKYPLCFLDYESFAYALPAQVSIRPYQQMVYQYSLHVQHEPDGEIQHYEYLLNSKEEPVFNLVKHLGEVVPDQHGHVVVWNQSFEKSRNNELGIQFPAYKMLFESLNNQLFDLMEIFRKQWYIHPHFRGKYSIKNVLPVLAPHLSYDTLSIGNGGISNIRWHQYTEGKIAPTEKEQVWKDLLDYCKLDTLAMVEILKSIKDM